MPPSPVSFNSDRRKALKKFALFWASSPLLQGQFGPREGHRRIPSFDEIANVLEFEPVARAKMKQVDYDYVAGAVEGEYSLKRNRRAFDWVSITPRGMTHVESIDTSVVLLGQRMEYPLLVAPSAGHERIHPGGEPETRRGASAAETPMIVSNQAGFSTDQIAQAAKGPIWQQLYIHRNREAARERVVRAADAGCGAICLTVDAQYSSLRERLRHDRHLTVRSKGTLPNRRSRRRRGTSTTNRRQKTVYGTRPESPDETWEFFETLRSWTDLPLLAKGLLTAEDAELAVKYGVEAIVVSNHGARYLEYTPSTIEVLPEIVDAVGGRIPVLIDGGFRRGDDIFKALAIGADAVLVGRPPLWGLGAFGAAGVERVLRMLQAELVLAMAHTGCTRIPDINRSLIKMSFP
jgi:isopentenyl diphosphate isomerase/L-lactate dehydrogenase-like FMN-dependent dehydrogenase